MQFWMRAVVVFICAVAGGCVTSSREDKQQLSVPSRVVRFENASFLMPAGLPAPQQQDQMLVTEATAAQIDPAITDATAIEVGMNLYHSPPEMFKQRPDVQGWVARPLPPDSRFLTSRTIVPSRTESVKIPGARDAAIAISLHEGVEQFGTGGMKALSLRLFVAPMTGDDGWVVGAWAVGSATNPDLDPGSRLASIFEEALRSFRLEKTNAPATSGSR